MRKKQSAQRPQEKNGEEQKERKEKKVKVVYYDDGSTVADMSGTRKHPQRQKATFKEQAHTFFTVMKKMVLPMLVTLAALTIVFLIMLAAAGKL